MGYYDDGLREDLEREHHNEDMMREYNNRSFEYTSISYDDSIYIDPYYGDVRDYD